MYSFVFPGQGSQTVGMGRELYDAFPCAREVFAEVDEALQQNLTKVIFEGPQEELTLTTNAQPALMAVSMAAVRVLMQEFSYDLTLNASCVAGHSLGEYSALAAMEAFSLTDAARLLRTRGEAMQASVPIGKGAMAAILGMDFEVVEAVTQDASKNGVCVIANDNAPGQIVISGYKETVQSAIELASAKGCRKSILLPVSAPFHCDLMAPAADIMKGALLNTSMTQPPLPLVANVSTDFVDDPQTVKDLLVQQVTGRVRWRESVLKMAEKGVTTQVEIGAGKVLTGLAKRITPDMRLATLNTPSDIETFVKEAS